jgi:hypothetical protein
MSAARTRQHQGKSTDFNCHSLRNFLHNCKIPMHKKTAEQTINDSLLGKVTALR